MDNLVLLQQTVHEPFPKFCIIGNEISIDGETIGVIDAGILDIKQSPDEQLIAILACDGSLIILNADYNIINEIKLGKGEDGKISWRADGEYFVVSFGTKLICFERDGSQFSECSVSSPIIAYRPDGSLIATVEGTKIIFREKNLLERFQLAINEPILDVEWSADSTIMAVLLEDRIVLYTTKNYHYYSKFSIKGKYDSISWDEEKLALYAGNFKYLFGTKVTHSYGKVIVVDGKNLRITPFGKVNVPPPMYDSTIEVSDFPIDLAFGRYDNEDVLAVLHSKEIVLYSEGSKKRFSIDLEGEQIVVGNNSILVKSQGRVYFIDENNLEDIGESNGVLFGGSVIGFTNDEAVYSVINGESKFESIFPKPCTNVISVNSCGNLKFIGQCGNRLFCGESELAKDCTSFIIGHDFLIMSSYKHNLQFISLEDDAFQFIESYGQGFDASKRKIEQGARIVTSTTSEVVLEMPRGNLEIISPRIIVLKSLSEQIKQKNWRESFMLCRRHRIEMNILIDVDINSFLSDADKFARVLNEEYLCLFITSLKEEDVTKTMYVGTSNDSQNVYVAGKIAKVCEALRGSLTELKLHKALLCTYAQQNLLVDALKFIVTQSEQEELLKYLIFLVDVELLYKRALSIYDWKLCALVAQHSNMDPREYLPFLKNIQSMSINMGRYFVCDYLGDFTVAFQNLANAESEKEVEFNKVLEYIVKHNLYQHSLERYVGNEAILTSWAEFVEGKRDYGQAALLFELGQKNLRAIENYLRANDWKRGMALVSRAKEDTNFWALKFANELETTGHFQDASCIHEIYLKSYEAAIKLLIKGNLWSDAFCMVERHGVENQRLVIAQAVLQFAREQMEDMDKKRKRFIDDVGKLEIVRAEKTAFIEGGGDTGIGVDLLDDTASMATTATISTVRSKYSMTTTKSGKSSRQKRKKQLKRAGGKDPFYRDEYLMKELQLSTRKLNEYLEGPILKELLSSLIYLGAFEMAASVQKSVFNYVSEVNALLPTVFRIQVIPRPVVDGTEMQEFPEHVEVIERVSVTEKNWSFDILN